MMTLFASKRLFPLGLRISQDKDSLSRTLHLKGIRQLCVSTHDKSTSATKNESSRAPRMVPFPVLDDPIDVNCPQLSAASLLAEEQLTKLSNLADMCRLGGGDKAREAYARKKLLPRDRVSRLWDDPEKDMFEIGTLAGLGMTYGDVPGAGVITGIGRIHGKYCVVSANDGTVKGGTYFPIGVRKSKVAAEIAERLSLPLVLLIDSGGAFLPLQSEIFPDKNHGGRMFYMSAVLGGRGIPSVGVVCGSCTAGGAYAPTMCDESAIVQGAGTLFLAGPPLVKAALGEVVTAQQLGGAVLHTEVSGVCDYSCADEAEALEIVRDVIATTPITPPASLSSAASDGDAPLYPADTLDSISCLSRVDKQGMLAIILRVVDGSRFRIFKGNYGKHLTLGYATIGGRAVGVAANHGPLSYEDGLKGAQFVQICQHRRMPLILLQNSGVSDADPDSVSTRVNALRGRAAMAQSIACLDTPKITVTVGRCGEDDLLSMCGPGFDPTFSFSWPSGSLQYFGGSDDAAESDGAAKKTRSMFSFPLGSSWYNAGHLLTDELIAPHTTRSVLLQCLDICSQQLNVTEKDFPVYRL